MQLLINACSLPGLMIIVSSILLESITCCLRPRKFPRSSRLIYSQLNSYLPQEANACTCIECFHDSLTSSPGSCMFKLTTFLRSVVRHLFDPRMASSPEFSIFFRLLDAGLRLMVHNFWMNQSCVHSSASAIFTCYIDRILHLFPSGAKLTITWHCLQHLFLYMSSPVIGWSGNQPAESLPVTVNM